jgi:hypothetical protein
MTTLTINQHAQLEIDRRGLPKNNPARRHVGGDLDLPVASEATTLGCFRLGRADLATLAQKAAAKAKPKVKAARPTGPGSRGGDPVKRARALLADQAGPRGSREWWAAYKASK